MRISYIWYFFFFLVNTPFYSLSALLLSPPPPTAAHCELRHLKARHNDQQSTALACLDSSQIFFFFTSTIKEPARNARQAPCSAMCRSDRSLNRAAEKIKGKHKPFLLMSARLGFNFVMICKKNKTKQNFVNIYTHYCTKHMHTHTHFPTQCN